MEFKKSILILILAVFIVSIAGVCAADANDTLVASEDNLEIDQTNDDVIGVGEDTDLASSEENEILSADEQTFAQLNTTINGNNDKDIYLNGNYNYSSGDDSFKGGVVINRDVNIHGNGATIDGNKEARIFQINGGNVVFYNITFVNGYAGVDNGGAINGNCKAIKCTFKQNHATYGGAMDGGSAVNCNFTGNEAYEGGAMFGGSAVNCTFTGNIGTDGSAMFGGSAVNCTFTGNSARDSGTMFGGSAVNCTFSGNTAYSSGGAMNGGSAVNCTFSGNTAKYGGAMDMGYKMNCIDQDPNDYINTKDLLLKWDANDFTTIYGSDEKLPIQLKNQNNESIDFINYDVVIYKDGSKVWTYHCLSNDELAIDLLPGIYAAELMVTYPGINQPEPKYITLTVDTDGTTFTDLNKTINDNTNDTITLDKDYTFNSTVDSAFTEGIIINRQVTINGNGHTIDANGKARVFNVQADDVTINNLTIKNANYNGNGGAIYFSQSGSVTNCNFTKNTASLYGGAIFFAYGSTSTVENCNFTGNEAKYGAAIRFNGNGNVTNCNFTGNKADYRGGAIWFTGNGNVTNCNFTGNEAKYGGAIRFNGNGNVTNCNFTKNTAGDSGGAIWFAGNGNVTNCNFTNNSATSGGAVYFDYGSTGTVVNCNFTGNKATGDDGCGGAIMFVSTGTVENCNFTKNTASNRGGAIYFSSSGSTHTVTNCNFTENKATGDDSWGGAIYMSSGSVENCNFTSNTATYNGGAVYFNGTGEVTNCTFVNNSAIGDGGAILMRSGSVENCNFTDNRARSGGGVYIVNMGTVSICNFINNTATDEGGAVMLENEGTVINCNFTDNTATGEYSYGGAIRIGYGIVLICKFTNNSANNGGAIFGRFVNDVTFDTCILKTDSDTIIPTRILPPTLNVDNFTTFYGTNEKLTFDLKTNSSIPVPNGNISISVYFKGNNSWVGNYSCLSGEGWIPDLRVGSYYAIFDTEYAEFQKINRSITVIIPVGKYYVNVTSLATNNKTVNITAKTNVPKNITWEGKLLFILPNGDVINATYASNGIWWAVHTFDDYTDYEVNASYVGLDNVAINNATISITKSNSTVNVGDVVLNYVEAKNVTVKTEGATGITALIDNNPVSVINNYTIPISGLGVGTYTLTVTTIADADHNPITKNVKLTVTDGTTFTDLNKAINDNTNDTITLDGDYVFNSIVDSAFTEGIIINRQVTINGNGHTIDANGKARVFNVQASDVTINNLTIKNAKSTSNGGAIYFSQSGTVTNCNFVNNTASSRYGGAVYFSSNGNVSNCNFTDNTASEGGAVYFNKNGEVTNCNFVNNTASIEGGAIYFDETGIVSNCTFTNNQATRTYNWGGAVYFSEKGIVTNCTFTNNAGGYGGAIYFYGGYGGAIYFYRFPCTVTNCNFVNNTASIGGGAIFFNRNGDVTNSNFTGNNATTGSAIYFNNWDSLCTLTISNSTFLNNKANVDDNTPLNIIVNGNNITIKFMGQNHLLNAIHSDNDGGVKFTNVAYWGAQGITNTDDNYPSRSNRESGQNITIAVVVNDKLVLNEVKVTDENGTIVLDINVGENYYIIARHDEDSYYTKAETILTNMKFYVNVTETKTTNKTVNITAKSNIKPEVMPGKLLFILPNGNEINATYGADGIWWAVYTFDDYADYQVNASYIGLDNVTISNATISISKANSTVNVSDVVLNYGESTNVTVTAEGATGITAKINDTNVTVVNNFTIPISGLAAGNYTLTVTTVPDGDHNSVTKTVNITVNKAGTEITLTNETLYLKAGDIVSDLANLTPADAGNLTFQSSNEDIAIAADGTIYARIKGNVTVTVSFAGTDNYTAAENKTITVYVTLKDASVSVENETLNLNVDEKYEFNPTVNPSFLAVQYSSSNESVVTVTDYGLVRAVGEGTAIITLTVGNNQTYAINTTNVTVTVSLNDASVSVNNSTLDLFVDDTFTIVATTDPAGLNVTFVPDNSGVYTVDENGTVIALMEGTGSILVKVGGDGVYVENSTNVTVTVSKIPSEIIVQNVTVDMKVTDEVVPVVSLMPSGAGELDFTSSDVSVVTVSGIGTITAVGEGVANVTVRFIGNDKYAAAESKNITVTVSLNDAGVSVNNSTLDLFVDDTFTIVATTDPAGLNVTYVPDNSGVYSVDSNGVVTALMEGTGSILVKVGGDGVYAENSTTVTVTVSKIPTEIVVQNATIDMKVTDEVVPVVSLNPSVAGELDFTSSDVSVVTVDGIGTITAVGEGVANVTVRFIGNDKYVAAESKNITVTVSLNDVSVSVNNSTLDLQIGDNFTVVATTVPAGLNVTFVPDNSGVYTVDSNGVVTALKNGTATIIVKVGGDGVYAENSTNVTVTVSKRVADVVVSVPKKVTVGQNATVNIRLPSDATGNVTVSVDGTNGTTVSITNGTANFTLSNLGAGSHAVNITYTGDNKYAPWENKTSFTVNKISTKLAADKVTATYNVNKNLVITLKDANGNALSGVEVTVKIKGSKTYTTDKNGQVKVNVAKLVPKTYTAKISFAGNAKYAASSASAKVTVKKAKPKMTAKKKTFKAKKKVKKYTITLKDNKGKAIKKAKVTLKVKGKTYKAKTNKKGKATFKIKNLKKKGTYKAVIKYKGNKYYKKLTKKVKIKVKKSAFKTLSKGSKDKKTVKRIQQALKDHGYYLTYKGQYLKIDGIYHGNTERSVKEFQKDHGLKVTGKVDEKTAKKLGIL